MSSISRESFALRSCLAANAGIVCIATEHDRSTRARMRHAQTDQHSRQLDRNLSMGVSSASAMRR